MKELYINMCPEARLIVEVTEEMEQDFYECWDVVTHTEDFKDCDTCSWRKVDVTGGSGICGIVAEQCSREGKIFYDENE